MKGAAGEGSPRPAAEALKVLDLSRLRRVRSRRRHRRVSGIGSRALPSGAELRLVGADPALGRWDPARGWPLTGDPSAPDRFEATVPLRGRSRLRAKLVLVAADGSVTWEAGADRRLRVHDRDAPQDLDLGRFRRSSTGGGGP